MDPRAQGPDRLPQIRIPELAARLGLPKELRRALATTNMIESTHSMVRQTCRGRQEMARRRDGIAEPAPGCWRPASACGVSGLTGSCRSSGLHWSVITRMLSNPPTLTSKHGRHSDQPAASTDASFNIDRDIPPFRKRRFSERPHRNPHPETSHLNHPGIQGGRKRRTDWGNQYGPITCFFYVILNRMVRATCCCSSVGMFKSSATLVHFPNASRVFSRT